MNCRWVLWSLLAANCSGSGVGDMEDMAAKSRQSSGPMAEAATVRYETHAKDGRADASRRE